MVNKLRAFLKYLIVKIINYKKLKSQHLFYIGKYSKILIDDKGLLRLLGKFHIHDFVDIEVYGKLIVGNRCAINKYSRIIAKEYISLGENVIIAQFVTIIDHDHNIIFKNNKLQLEKRI